MSEALNLDWTKEDEAAYNALESPHRNSRLSDEENLEDDDDDLLGEELHDVIQFGSVGSSKSFDVSAKVKNLSDKLKCKIVSLVVIDSENETNDGDLGPARPKVKKKEPIKKKKLRHVS